MEMTPSVVPSQPRGSATGRSGRCWPLRGTPPLRAAEWAGETVSIPQAGTCLGRRASTERRAVRPSRNSRTGSPRLPNRGTSHAAPASSIVLVRRDMVNEYGVCYGEDRRATHHPFVGHARGSAVIRNLGLGVYLGKISFGSGWGMMRKLTWTIMASTVTAGVVAGTAPMQLAMAASATSSLGVCSACWVFRTDCSRETCGVGRSVWCATDGPALASPGIGRLELFSRTPGSELQERDPAAGGWGRAASLGGQRWVTGLAAPVDRAGHVILVIGGRGRVIICGPRRRPGSPGCCGQDR